MNRWLPANASTNNQQMPNEFYLEFHKQFELLEPLSFAKWPPANRKCAGKHRIDVIPAKSKIDLINSTLYAFRAGGLLMATGPPDNRVLPGRAGGRGYIGSGYCQYIYKNRQFKKSESISLDCPAKASLFTLIFTNGNEPVQIVNIPNFRIQNSICRQIIARNYE